jgi:chorismate mutase/predicted MFS family arabinose efflux permease
VSGCAKPFANWACQTRSANKTFDEEVDQDWILVGFLLFLGGFFMESSDRRRLGLSLYLNYFVHGIGLIILAQNMKELGNLWDRPLATVSYVISGIGIGKLLAYLLLGVLADRFGRKNFIYFGMACYFAFFTGMLVAPTIQIAYLLAILAGIANSALDTGTYPTFIELGGNNGSSNILIKAFMSAGEFVLPLLVAFLENNNLWFGWSFILPAVVLVLNLFLFVPVKFPPANQTSLQKQQAMLGLSSKKRWALAVSLALYGYTSMAIMILYTQWISLYAEKILHFSNWQAHFLLSIYSIGSIIGVLILFTLLKKNVKETTLLINLNLWGLLSLLVVCWGKAPLIVTISSFVFGVTAAGGVMQTGLNLFLKLFPKAKGLLTGIFFTFGSIALFSVPIFTGWLSKTSVALALRSDIVICLVGLGLVILTWYFLKDVSNLKRIRHRISFLDHWIVILLEQRFKEVKQVGQLKATQNKPVLDENREQLILEKIAQQSSNQQLVPYLQDIYRQIMKNSRNYEATDEKNNKSF